MIAPHEVEHGNDYLILKGQRYEIRRKIDELNYVLSVGLTWRDGSWHFVETLVEEARAAA